MSNIYLIAIEIFDSLRSQLLADLISSSLVRSRVCSRVKFSPVIFVKL